MRCRHCDTEIDDRALICFRCGEATSEPVHQPPSRSHDRAARAIGPVVLVVSLVVGAFVLAATSEDTGVSPTAWLMLAAAGLLLVWRIAYRR